MTDDKEQALVRDFPDIFRDNRKPRTCMLYGCCVGDGWEPILRRLMGVAAEENAGKPLDLQAYAVQVKEKFGGLRVYWANATDRLYKETERAERESYLACEDCGTAEGVTVEGSWVRTLCGPCRQRRRTDR